MAATKATFALPDETLSYLREQAAQRNISMADVLRQAIGTDKYFRDKADAGASVLVKEPGSAIKEVVLNYK